MTTPALREGIERSVHEAFCLGYHSAAEGKAHVWETCGNQERFRHAADAILALVGKVERENDLRKRIIDRLPLCPDHRDKVRGCCVECNNERLRTTLADAEARNLMSYCAWCGGEFPHPTREARREAITAHTLDCAKRPEAMLTDILLGYERMIADAFAMLQRAASAEDPDEWIREGTELLDKLQPIVEKIAIRGQKG